MRLFWTQRRVAKLQSLSAQANAGIARLFADAVIRPQRDRCAWGQFLDESRDNTQYGIFGTCAAVQILLAEGYPPTHELIKDAQTTLTEAYEDGAAVFATKGDLLNTYKVAFLAEASNPAANQIDDTNPVFDHLAGWHIPGLGWGEFHLSSTAVDSRPRVLATAAALLGLRRYRPFFTSKGCEEALAWLVKRILENRTIQLHELGLAGIALSYFTNLSLTIPDWGTCIRHIQDQLKAWATQQEATECGSSAMYHYSSLVYGRRANKYLFFLSDCIACLALLRLGCPEEARAYVLATCQCYATAISTNRGFAPENTGRFSSVDHLWIYRLLRELQAQNPRTMVTPRLATLFSYSWPIRVSMIVAFLVVGGLGVFAGVNNQGAGSVLLTALGSVVASLGFGLAVEAIWSSISGRK